MNTNFKIIRFWLVANYVQLITIFYLTFFAVLVCRIIFNF